MKSKISQAVLHSYKDIISVVILIIMTTALLMYFYGLQNMDMSIPFGYDGTDTMSSLVEAKMTQESGWNIYTYKLAAPYGYNNSNNLITGLHNFDQLLLKFFTSVTGEYVKGVNYTFLATFYLIGLITYFVLRCLKLREWISIGGALTFAFLPFIFFRNIEHLVLSSYYFIPLLILLCLWIYEDKNFLVLNKSFFSYKKNILAIIFTALIANSGIVYWQFLGCFFLVATALANVVRNREFRCIRQSLLCIISIIVFMIIGCISEIISIVNGSSGIEGRLRSMYDSEAYSLKLIQLIMPVRSHGISYLENIIENYNTYAPLVNENASAYLGLVGVIGFFVLLLMLFKKKSDSNSTAFKRLCALSELNICAVLFGTMGGFGAVFFAFVSQTLRGFNRISVYIAFFSITAVCIIFNEVENKIESKLGNNTKLKENTVKNDIAKNDILKDSILEDSDTKINITKKKIVLSHIICAVVGSIIMLIGILEQNPHIDIPYIENYENWTSDDNFVKNIESSVSSETMIFQLPYQEYPEAEGQGLMKSQDPFVGYLHSSTLKWSFGINKESENAEWYSDTSELSPQSMVDELKSKGFGGIYIDRYGLYEDDKWQELEKELEEYLHQKPLVSDNERYSFFNIVE